MRFPPHPQILHSNNSQHQISPKCHQSLPHLGLPGEPQYKYIWKTCLVWFTGKDEQQVQRFLVIKWKHEGKHIMRSLNSLNCVKWLNMNIFKYNSKELDWFLAALQNTPAALLNCLIKYRSKAHGAALASEDYRAPHITLSGNNLILCLLHL